MAVHCYGNTAVVTGAYYEKGVDKGKSWERRGRFTDSLEEPGWEVAMYRQPLQRQAKINSRKFVQTVWSRATRPQRQYPIT